MFRSLSLGLACALVATGARAHVSLQPREGTVGAPLRAVLRVPHGCDGSATTAIRVRIPAGVVEVKPMPKSGWKLDVVRGKYPKVFNRGGAKFSEGVTEIDWSGGRLPDAFYEEFVFIAEISDNLQAGDKVYFPVVQECEKGVVRWIERPAGGEHGSPAAADDESSLPAPGLTLVPKR